MLRKVGFRICESFMEVRQAGLETSDDKNQISVSGSVKKYLGYRVPMGPEGP